MVEDPFLYTGHHTNKCVAVPVKCLASPKDAALSHTQPEKPAYLTMSEIDIPYMEFLENTLLKNKVYLQSLP